MTIMFKDVLTNYAKKLSFQYITYFIRENNHRLENRIYTKNRGG